MQPGSRQCAVVAAFVLAGTIAACNSSHNLGPTEPIWLALAFHFDPIYTNLTSSSTNATVDSTIAHFVAQGGEITPGFGGVASPVTVTTAGGTQTWEGFTYEEADTGAGGDSSFTTLVYSNPAMAEAILAQTNYNASGNAGGTATVILNLAAYAADSAYTGAASTVSTKTVGSCSLLSGLAASSDTLVARLSSFTCQPATFTVSFSAGFPASANAGPLSTVSVASTTFTGVRLFGAPSGSHVVKIPTRAAALIQRLRGTIASRAQGH
jgi:hypothetical protein